MKSLSFYISKRAKIIEPPEQLLGEIFSWARGVLSRLILEDKNLDSKVLHATEKTDIEKLKSDAKKFATNEPLFKRFFVDLIGWKHEDKFPDFLSINVRFDVNEKVNMASWDLATNSIIIYYHPFHTISLNFHNLKSSIAHELIHLFQDYRLDSSGVPGEFGLPGRKTRMQEKEYEGRDMEFYPLLLCSARSISRWLLKMDKSLWIDSFKTFIGLNNGFKTILENGNESEIKPFKVFKYLKEKNIKKWKIAVKLLYTYLKENINFGG